MYKRQEDEKKELTLTEVTYILMNSDIDKIIIIHKESESETIYDINGNAIGHK